MRVLDLFSITLSLGVELGALNYLKSIVGYTDSILCQSAFDFESFKSYGLGKFGGGGG